MAKYFIQLMAVCLVWVATLMPAAAQSVFVAVKADHPDWIYKTGEKALFSVEVTRDNKPLEGVTVNYQTGLERISPAVTGDLVLEKGSGVIEGGSLKEPGFLRCIVTVGVDGKQYRGLATAAYEPEHIKPTTTMPADFVAFWKQATAEAARIPMDAQMRLLPDKCTGTVNVYQVSVQNYRQGSRIYGILSMPKKEGRYPAVLKVPGAGVGSYSPDITLSEKGMIVLRIEIHGLPFTLSDSAYKAIANGRLKGYPLFGHDNRDAYYFKRVFMGCIRSVDFLCGLPQFDGTNLAVAGGSQGGALTIATAALDHRVKYMVAYFPGLSDLTGYLYGRTGGWPHLLKDADKVTKKEVETSRYYDMANFARLIKIPGFYSWGFNDETCPPTTAYAVYNTIRAPKELLLVKESGHQYTPEQRVGMDNWLQEKLTGSK
ncbi:acetylxylan esterase [Niabella beijingensis]|uniref:acetylxylan esterase n=1 Tax=Niabella beijingensis TaxID=2872700 RepID=UPI001CBD58BB|nr:acetylxylan esterase [Niabella beijingensis]MBZ4188606.1 acetylxylan esterase [Niabella beijingensis]